MSNPWLNDLEDAFRKHWRLTFAPLRHRFFGIPIEGIPKIL
jgi:hypothetical protein